MFLYNYTIYCNIEYINITTIAFYNSLHLLKCNSIGYVLVLIFTIKNPTPFDVGEIT